MKRIAILGSAPGAPLPPADELFCANGAAGAYGEAIRTRSYAHVTNVVQSWILRPATRAGGIVDSAYFHDLWRKVLQAPSDEILLTGHRVDIGTEEALRAAGCTKPIVTLSDEALFFDMTPRISGLRHTVLTREVFAAVRRLPWSDRRKALRSLANTYQRRWRRIEHRDPAPIFRPSTGLVALMVAIDRHGTDAAYVLSGISFNDRNVYQGADARTAYNVSAVTQHIWADIALLRHLSECYTIFDVAGCGIGRVNPFPIAAAVVAAETRTP